MVALVMTYPLWVHPGRTLPSDLNDTLLTTWIISWDSQRMLHGLRGLWEAPFYYPYHNSLAFSENLLGLAIFVAPVFWVTENPVLTYNVAFLLSFALAGLGMYLLAGALVRNRAAALIAAIFFAFCPLRMSHVSHIQMVATGWIPIALFGLHRYFSTRRARWLAVFVAGYLLQVLSNMYMAYMLAVPVVIVIAAGLWRDAGRWRPAAHIALAGAAIVALLLPLVVRYHSARADYRQVRGIHEIDANAADLRSYLVGKRSVGLLQAHPITVTTDPEKELFPGFVVLLFASAALLFRKRLPDASRRWVAAYALVVVTAVVCSLGPTVRVWGHELTRHGPYAWLLQIVPGMDGMRVPSRFAMIVNTGLAVLAAYGAHTLLVRLRPSMRLLAAAVAVAMILSEGWVVPLTTVAYHARGRLEDRAVADWLKPRPPGAVLHLPVRTNDFQEVKFQYATLFHGHPIVNGYSGYDSPLQALLRDYDGPMYDVERGEAVVRMLRSIGVRYVAVHTNDYSMTQLAVDEHRKAIGMLRGSGQLAGETLMLGVYVFELEPWHEEAAPEVIDELPVDPAELVVTVSAGEQRRGYLTDNDPETRWIGFQDGSSWIATELARPYDLSRVELRLAERSIVDVPRQLRIDSIDAHGEARTLYHATPYPEFLAGFLREPASPAVAVDLPPNQTTKLWIRETAALAGRRWWSVHELKLWRRRCAECGPRF
jgi:hypothetical protein